MVERSVNGLKFLSALEARPFFSVSGLTRPTFIEAGNSGLQNDLFAAPAIMTDSSSVYDFIIDYKTTSHVCLVKNDDIVEIKPPVAGL